MKLLNVYTLKLASFEGRQIPPYAIASHRWTDDETTYLDVSEGKNKKSEGYKKIKAFCNFVKWRNTTVQTRYRSSGAIPYLEWIWIDTCCIDHRSSEDVSENIISMYRYYEQAVECYAYLSDITSQSMLANRREFHKSSWWSRGWTLQELLAPSRVFFLNSFWEVIGHKCSGSSFYSLHDTYTPFPCHRLPCAWGEDILNTAISRRTGISIEVLCKLHNPRDLSPDVIHKWMEGRQTKRPEDQAYCLLGLFNISMTPRYGEGDEACSRLRRKVQKKRNDTSAITQPSQTASRTAGQQHSMPAQPLRNTSQHVPYHSGMLEYQTQQPDQNQPSYEQMEQQRMEHLRGMEEQRILEQQLQQQEALTPYHTYVNEPRFPRTQSSGGDEQYWTLSNPEQLQSFDERPSLRSRALRKVLTSPSLTMAAAQTAVMATSLTAMAGAALAR